MNLRVPLGLRTEGDFLCTCYNEPIPRKEKDKMTEEEFKARKLWDEDLMTDEEKKAHWERIHSFCGKIDDETFIIHPDAVPPVLEGF